jgi:hypothetical protein
MAWRGAGIPAGLPPCPGKAASHEAHGTFTMCRYLVLGTQAD